MKKDTTAMQTRNYVCCLIALMLVAAGCALSPQTVNIRPDITIPSAEEDEEKAAIALEVTDNRASRVLGRRGGVYSETATISTREDITADLRRVLAGALERMGYRIVGSGAAPALRVEITALEYTVTKHNVTRNVETHASIDAVYTRGTKTYTNTYKNTRTTEMLTPPDAEENEKLINETLAAALQQMLQDRELFGLING